MECDPPWDARQVELYGSNFAPWSVADYSTLGAVLAKALGMIPYTAIIYCNFDTMAHARLALQRDHHNITPIIFVKHNASAPGQPRTVNQLVPSHEVALVAHRHPSSAAFLLSPSSLLSKAARKSIRGDF